MVDVPATEVADMEQELVVVEPIEKARPSVDPEVELVAEVELVDAVEALPPVVELIEIPELPVDGASIDAPEIEQCLLHSRKCGRRARTRPGGGFRWRDHGSGRDHLG